MDLILGTCIIYCYYKTCHLTNITFPSLCCFLTRIPCPRLCSIHFVVTQSLYSRPRSPRVLIWTRVSNPAFVAPSRRDSRVCDFRVCYFLRLVFPAMRFPRLRPSHPMLKPAFPCAHSNSIYFSLPGLLPYFLSNALTRRFPGFRISEISLRFRRVISLSSCLTILLVMRVFSLPLDFPIFIGRLVFFMIYAVWN